MTATLAPTEANTLKALGKFLADVLSSDVEVFVGQTNRVPEPKRPNFVVMTPTGRMRLATNEDDSVDAQFTASIAGTTMTVTDVDFGAIAVGAPVFGVGVAAGTKVSALVSPGVYTVAPSQNVSSRIMAAGVTNAMQPTQVTIQCDVHGPLGADNAQIISTLFRDQYAWEQFAAQTPHYDVAPLYADDPRQLPFTNDQNQVENRWVIELHLQANAVATVPQQFANAAVVGLISVDERFPAQ